jgi:hypothetical protein
MGSNLRGEKLKEDKIEKIFQFKVIVFQIKRLQLK